MTESDNHPDPEIDPRLKLWLREAANAELTGAQPTGAQPTDAQLSSIDDHLAKARRTLLARLETADAPPAPAARPPGASNGPARRPPGLWARHRIAVGGIAASIALAGMLLMTLHSGVQLSAMERMVKELQEITSYSYRSIGWNARTDDDGNRETRKNDSTVHWLAPDAFRQQTKIVKIVEDAAGGTRTEEILAHFEEVFPPGGHGVFIDHQYKTFCRITYTPIGSEMYPWDYLRLIREGSYDVLGDLGEKTVGETKAHGYRLTLKNQVQHGDEDNVLRDPIELWVDPNTDLPVEISWAGETEGWKYAELTNDFHWNAPLDPKRFVADVPPDYADITPPSDQKDLDEIVAALRLFAELSGGHYPQAKKFNPRRIHDGMLKMADSATPADPPARDQKREQIERATAGLKWIARILRNRFHSGYRGSKVGPTDRDQVLLWFADPDSDGYRVFYGDLRTEVLTEDQWAKLVPKVEIRGEPQSENFSGTTESTDR